MAQESVGPLAWMQQHQVPVYVAAMAVGAGIGVVAPGLGRGLEQGITPVLGALLYVTFLQVPAAKLLQSLRDGTFLGAALAVNFVVVPLVVAAMFTLLPADQAVRLGVLLVLLTPCVDYVIVFCGLAGGAAHRLLAATPLLLILQMLLLPAFLVLFMGPDLADVIEIGPFVEAFIVLIVVPLTLAWLTEAWAGRHRSGVVLTDAMGTVMVPLLALALLVVVASQVPQLGGNFGVVAQVVPFYVGFLLIMAVLGRWVALLFRLDPSGGRAIVFTGATRNSLVVLPLALALPDAYAVAALVIVTQTLVELIGMVLYRRAVPWLLPVRSSTP